MIIDIIFYICLLFPVLRIKSELFNLINCYLSYLLGFAGVNPRYHEEDVCLLDLPIIRFEDLQNHRHRSVDRMCFICAGDYDNGDVLCQLSRCGHVFHSDCVGKRLHRNQSFCPYCRTPIFSGLPPVLCS
ncbi:hypothetical protein R6Q59_037083 [Mikania micrantha]